MRDSAALFLLTACVALSAQATPEDPGTFELRPLCGSERYLVLGLTRSMNGIAQGEMRHALSWLTVDQEAGRMRTDADALVTTWRSAARPPQAREAGGRTLAQVLEAAAVTQCGEWYHQALSSLEQVGLRVEGTKVALVLEERSVDLLTLPAKESAVSGAPAWERLRPLDHCRAASPCPVKVRSRLVGKKNALLIMESQDGAEPVFVVVPTPLLLGRSAHLLNLAALAHHRAGRHARAVEGFSASLLAEQSEAARYNLACALARLGHAAEAVHALRPLGPSAALREKIERDADFDGIRGSPELTAFLAALPAP